MDIVVASRDADFVRSLYAEAATLEGFDVDEPSVDRSIVDFETLYTIAATVGVLSIPGGVIGNLIAAWILKAHKDHTAGKSTIETIEITDGNRSILITHAELTERDVTDLIKAAFEHLDHHE